MSTDLVSLLDIRVRPGEPGDVGYVIQTWGHSLRSEYPDARTTDFVDAVRKGIARRLEDGAKLYVAHPDSDPSLIIGWSCIHSDGMFHYVYVRQAYRRCGIARRLIGDGPDWEFHVDAMTDDLRAIRRKHPDRIRYLPNI